ncbi:DUF871 domain-containing protein [Oceanobacillus jeddahense]|uniref:MupG family TIM beta-alpha barrel fold protein n=1 Tax=Oceanobacillus jeddahense TaxID=1462527 RepID=A0ABY5JPZ4_9BACI|nr:MupG family TIM beta-alpha barrel fold protein [Oceanobacillus jeddahense]UUI02373.1 MupG family TIM beta-alpha barrel fold protein [Oceanobacillus jeddahense]
MMRRLGVSIYPEKSTPEQDKTYLRKAASYGFSRVFTCLLSVQKPKEEIKADFVDIISCAKELQMEVILDVAPTVFDQLGISYDELSFFAELGADGIRLDLGFDGLKEAQLTYNKYDLKIELNMSNDVAYLDNIMTHQPNTENLIGCHNFYPQKYTGLPYEFFISCSERFKKHHLRTAAFVTSSDAKMGPWNINDGLCTLEEHRNLPIDVQAKHLFATGLIDDVIIGNAYASDKELELLGKLHRARLELSVELEKNISDIEKTIMFEETHTRRGDISEYMVRSVEVRKKYAAYSVEAAKTPVQKRGDIFIGNDSFGKYKAELQVVLKDMPADERKNKVGHVLEEELFLLDYIHPWGSFTLREK